MILFHTFGAADIFPRTDLDDLGIVRMDEKAFSAAIEKLNHANRKLRDMEAAKTLDQLALLWEEFLIAQNGVYTRLKKATELGSAKGWFDRISNERSSDELLRYLLHARNAAEHGIERITSQEPGNVTLNSEPGKPLHIKRLEIRSGHDGMRIIGDRETLSQLRIGFTPGEVRLIAVKDRGIIYLPPNMHFGKPIQNVSPVVCANLGIAYLTSKVSEARANWFQNSLPPS
ncbi:MULTISPECIES: hypothetical protein [unclassified Methylosinus]|uniref:hypothetical protein n=1 Tax=unclassified Methylosinus TaxID=2624500 RepID=UPI0004B6521B|nr:MULTISPECIES: hypothetical protein [unclassified Methylosinus]